ncbi:MAG TPA: hypothetical protein VFU02_20040 [Polyangiaceae bacterium]|nr:hypothetical protein [Polyangiaceae bacterium]
MFHRPPPRLCLALALLGTLLPCCQEPSAAPGSTPSATATVGDRPFELDVMAVRDCEPAPYARLGNNEMLLGVKVKLRALSDQTPQNYFYASISDSERRRYPPSFDGCSPRLVGDPLAAGATATGFVNFVLPRDARGLSFEYAPRIGNTNKARGSLLARDLGR